MFEDALLDSSPRKISVLHRNHYLLSAFAGSLIFVQALYLLPLIVLPAGQRPLIIAASVVGSIASLYALMLCYVWADARQQHLLAWPWVGIALFLNLPGFMAYLVYSARKSGDWRRAAIPLAYVAESLLVGVMILVPLIYTQALPRQFLITGIHIAPPPGPPPASPAGPRLKPRANRHAVDPFTQPLSIPTHTPQIVEPVEPPRLDAGPVGPYVPGGMPGDGRGTGFVPGGASWSTATPPPIPPAHMAARTTTIRLSGPVVAAKAVYQPKPVYPHIAIISRTQGTVVLQATIGRDGSIQDLKVVSGHALLVQAALDAVRTWRYQPTLIGSEPVDVLTEIDVNFRLDE